jgi:hypothetical protein
MREVIRRGFASRVWLGLAFFVTVAIGFAQPPTTNFDMTGVQGASLAGVYTSPYYAEIGGSSVSTDVICDDFDDESFIPEDWNAYVTALSSVPATIGASDSYLKFGGDTSMSITYDGQTATLNNLQEVYATGALLAEDILMSPAGGYTAQVDSYALWGLFEPSDTQSYLDSYDLQSYWSAAQSAMYSAASAVASNGLAALNGATATIYSFASCTTPAVNCSASSPPQEFIVVTTPEPSSVAILGADLLAVAGLGFFLRRRVVRG